MPVLSAGARIVAEDSVCISYREGFAVWGCAREIGLRADALSLFADLAGREATPQPNGKTKLIVPVPPEKQAYPKHTGTVDLVLLEGAPGMHRLDPDVVRQRLLNGRESGFDLATDYADAVNVLLSHARTWSLGRLESIEEMVEVMIARIKAESA